jgi:hypothetical protein
MATSEPAAQFEAIPYPKDHHTQDFSQGYPDEPTLPQIPSVSATVVEPKLGGGERKMSIQEHSSPALNHMPMSATVETTEQHYAHPAPQQTHVEDAEDFHFHAISEPTLQQARINSTPGQKTALYDSPPQDYASPEQMNGEPAKVPVPDAGPSSAPMVTKPHAQSTGGEYGYGQGYQHDQQDYQDYLQYQNYAAYDYDQGYPAHAQNMDHLAAPQGDVKRYSVGHRPLPPSEIMETEDPEYRANRIRSFYKEYFDDRNPRQSMLVPPPPIPAHHLLAQAQEQQSAGQQPQQPRDQNERQSREQHAQQPVVHNQGAYQDQYYDYDNHAPHPPRGRNNHQGGAQYYEDYDSNYLGHNDAAIFDPETNTFVMPYAQPVHRRAMTPPPRGSRFRDGPPPRHTNHRFQGSLGGMSAPGGRGPRPGSAASSRFGPVRPGSSASGRFTAPRGRPKPPPSPLTTLPNPAKLKDDSFSIFNAADFAPPDGYKERQRGRSQSPAPERRPYHLNVPIVTPLSSSYEELGSVPSP